MLPFLHALCAPAGSPARMKSQDAGDRALGQAEGQEARLPTQAGSSTLAITSFLGLSFPKLSLLDKMISKGRKKKRGNSFPK